MLVLHYDVIRLIVSHMTMHLPVIVILWLGYGLMTIAHDSYYKPWALHMWLIWAHDLFNGFYTVTRYKS